ncbi:MAG: divergent PAP2 family protein [Spirochaetales bacterium]|nr:divergent PAP2 family protein [Spirochaetales bacterium]
MSETEYFSTIDRLSSNPVFMSALFSWAIAQLIKVIINIIRGKSEGMGASVILFLWKTGGMPSSHSSAIVGATTAIGFVNGVESSIFVLAFVMTIVVIRDALGVRRSTGVQAKAINYIGFKLNKSLNFNITSVKEVNGHTFPEVAVGIILGFFIAVAFCNL